MMAHQIMTVKLCELERRITKMYSRIQLSESSSVQRIRGETEALQKEYVENEWALRNQLRHSKPEIAGILSEAYSEIEPIICRAQERIKGLVQGQDGPEAATENKLLLAEYELDFSMLAIDRALLICLDAIADQLEQTKEEEPCRK